VGENNDNCFLYAKDIIIKDLCRKNSINGKFYKEVIDWLLARVHCIRLEFQEMGPLKYSA
jgi:hypothetical protein